ncbi:MAG: hypothetical protein QW520_07105 [Methanomassiliicoccales archaeon]
MAADSSVSHIMFFVAAVLVAGSLAGAFIGIANSMSKTIENRGEALGHQLQSDITIINDPVIVPYSDCILTLYIKNTGTATLTRNDLTILIDGLFCNYTVESSATAPTGWLPQKVIEVKIHVVLSSGDHVAKVVTANGACDQFWFRI